MLVEDFDQYQKPDSSGGVGILGDGLLLTDGERWQQQRSQLQLLFYRERVGTYAETMGAYAAAAADEWERAPPAARERPLRAVADRIEADADDIADLLSAVPRRLPVSAETAAQFRFYAGAAAIPRVPKRSG